MDKGIPFGEDDAILAAFQEDGVVVVSNVLSLEEVDEGLKELWTSPQLLGRDKRIDRNKSDTWVEGIWPQQNGGRNFLESLDPFQGRCCWEFAQHPKIVHTLQLLYGQEVFNDQVGTWGVMRPTVGNAAWRTDESWLHWDQNPWTEPDFVRIQCFVALTDQTSTSGGLLCVPKFQKAWRDWGQSNPDGSVFVHGRAITREFGRGNPFPVPLDDPMHKDTQRIMAPKGALVLWDARLPHQNYPSSGTDFRVVFYLQFVIADPSEVQLRREALRKKVIVMKILDQCDNTLFPSGLTDLGQKITGAGSVPETEDMEPSFVEAVRLVAGAGNDELNGDLKTSVEKLRRAGKVHPDIERWYDTIFGQ